MGYILLRAGLSFLSLAAVVTFGWGTYHQIKGQAATNEEMKQVAANIKKAGELTSITVQRMKPLVETAAVLQTMNGDLSDTGQLLVEMNTGLEGVTDGERTIVTNLTSLNHSILSTKQGIGQVSKQNQQLVGLTGALYGQVKKENGSMQQINGYTKITVAELKKLNKKLALLRVLP